MLGNNPPRSRASQLVRQQQGMNALQSLLFYLKDGVVFPLLLSLILCSSTINSAKRISLAPKKMIRFRSSAEDELCDGRHHCQKHTMMSLAAVSLHTSRNRTLIDGVRQGTLSHGTKAQNNNLLPCSHSLMAPYQLVATVGRKMQVLLNFCVQASGSLDWYGTFISFSRLFPNFLLPTVKDIPQSPSPITAIGRWQQSCFTRNKKGNQSRRTQDENSQGTINVRLCYAAFPLSCCRQQPASAMLVLVEMSRTPQEY